MSVQPCLIGFSRIGIAMRSNSVQWEKTHLQADLGTLCDLLSDLIDSHILQN